ncbi:MAG: pentapeptide repeat-containing protein [Planctomycetota bacterium]
MNDSGEHNSATNPSAPPSDASAATRPSVWARWLPRVAAAGTTLAAFILGLNFNLARQVVASQHVFFFAAGVGLVVAAVFLAVLHVLNRRARARLQTATQESVGRLRELAEALAEDRRRAPDRPPPDLAPLVKQAFEAGPTVVTAWLTGRAYWRLFLGLGSVIGAAVLVSQLVVLYEQTTRLTQQNRLIAQEGTLSGIQARLDAINTQAQLDLAEAQRRYDEITQILFESTSPAAQEYALVHQLPEAMLMTVTTVDPQWDAPQLDLNQESISTDIDKITLYPNLRRLAEQLIVFAKIERIKEGDKPSSQVSTAIVRALHRLGPGFSEGDTDVEPIEAAKTSWPSCVWELIFVKDGAVHTNWQERARQYLADGSVVLNSDPYPDGKDEHHPAFLEHLNGGKLAGAHLEGANLRKAKLSGLNLNGIHLQGADLFYADLSGAFLGGANLDNSSLSYARLIKTNFKEAQLNGAALNHVFAQRAIFTEAHLRGADLESASLQSACFHEAQAQGATLNNARLHGARLSNAQLQETDWYNAHLVGVDMREANLQGSILDASLEGANLSRSKLQGAWVSSSLQGANLCGAEIHGTDLSGSIFVEGDVEIVPCEELNPIGDRPVTVWSIPYDPISNVYVKDYGLRLTLKLGVANLGKIKVGRGWVIDTPVDREDIVRQAYASQKLITAYWSTREEAEEAVRSALGDEFLDYLVERPTLLEGAQLDGVLIDCETLTAILPSNLDIFFSEALDKVETNQNKIKQWRSFELPNPAEFIRRQRADEPTSVSDHVGD